jgi:hypothetical protein
VPGSHRAFGTLVYPVRDVPQQREIGIAGNRIGVLVQVNVNWPPPRSGQADLRYSALMGG